jgi:hypothetical protein
MRLAPVVLCLTCVAPLSKASDRAWLARCRCSWLKSIKLPLPFFLDNLHSPQRRMAQYDELEKLMEEKRRRKKMIQI